MLNNKLNFIDCGKEKYPVVCDFNVLEEIQEKFETVHRFQALVSGLEETGVDKDTKEPIYKSTPINVLTMLQGMTLMVNEGIDMYNEELSKKPGVAPVQLLEHVEQKQIGMILRRANISLSEAAMLVVNELTTCINPKKEIPGKKKESQVTKTRLSILPGYSMLEKLFSIIRKKR